MTKSRRGGPRSILGTVIIYQFVNSDIINFLLKINEVLTNFANGGYVDGLLHLW